MASLDPDSLNQAYEVLRRNAEALRNQNPPRIDNLVPIVEESLEAYVICTARLDTVKAALQGRLGGDGNGRGLLLLIDGAVLAEGKS